MSLPSSTTSQSSTQVIRPIRIPADNLPTLREHLGLDSGHDWKYVRAYIFNEIEDKIDLARDLSGQSIAIQGIVDNLSLTWPELFGQWNDHIAVVLAQKYIKKRIYNKQHQLRRGGSRSTLPQPSSRSNAIPQSAPHREDEVEEEEVARMVIPLPRST